MDLIDPSDSLERQNEKLQQIVEALMRKVEQSPDQTGLAYAQFERAAMLEEQVRQRTVDLERTLDLLHESNARFALARQEAEDARANLADAIETINEGFALFDHSDRLVLYNSRFCEALGDVRRQLSTGLAFDDYIALISGSADLDWKAEETPASWRKTRMRLHRKDHVVFNIRLKGNRWMQVSEHRTDTRGTVILQTDVSEIMRLERQERDKLVHKQALMLRATLDHIKQGICIFDHHRRLVGWNRRMEDLLRRRIGPTFRGGNFEELLDRLEDLFTYSGAMGKSDLSDWARIDGGREALSFEVLRNDAAIFDVFMQEMPDRGFVISFTDITQERQTSSALRELNETLEKRVSDRTIELGDALEAAKRANASKTRFVAAASHDLLQPMSAAKLYTSVLEDRLSSGSEHELLRKTTSALESAESIITALLDISKLDLGLATYDLTSVDLNRVFTTLFNEFAPLAKARGLDLRFVPTSLKVRSDQSYLYRILQNIISNAIRYTTGRKILVGVRRLGDVARIDVCDQGPGISADDQSLIFQEFQQLKKVRGDQVGLGLGLAIVDRACKMLDHGLDLRSEPGGGSCFSVSLKLSRRATPVQAPVKTPDMKTTTRGLLVGLVENDAALRNSISLTIEALGSDVLQSRSGEDALELYKELGVVPDGFLLDYQLGEGISGTDLVPALRDRYGALPIVIISANRSQQLHDRCQALGVALAHKPLSRAKIADFLVSLQNAE
ncbi:hybrid sensor histidine kinase/response regulator [Roseobacter cerasinus]|uniref:histidine kinase n=1 Tax=Roseobacter cerasinus TaxID=2602289 RepID=A0A640VQS3_9RHOB|nr:PAS-domain containing protein [Roseobacter cerasinus]GFE50758.1 hybrid sensor histidine kinase/response regulator [Roseobacter cerasinus]